MIYEVHWYNDSWDMGNGLWITSSNYRKPWHNSATTVLCVFLPIGMEAPDIVTDRMLKEIAAYRFYETGTFRSYEEAKAKMFCCNGWEYFMCNHMETALKMTHCPYCGMSSERQKQDERKHAGDYIDKALAALSKAQQGATSNGTV